MFLDRITNLTLGGWAPPGPDTPINESSQQADGLYWHAPLVEPQRNGGQPTVWRETRGGGYGISFNGSGALDVAQDPDYGLWVPKFPGTGAGNNTHAIGFANTQVAASTFYYNFNYNTPGSKYQYNPPRMSWSIWLRPISITGRDYNMLFVERVLAEADPYSNWGVGYTTGGSLEAYCSSGSAGTQIAYSSSNGLITNGSWQLVVCTYDGSRISLYHNGSLIGSTSGSLTIGNATNTHRLIGSSTQALFGNYCCNAYIRDARLYDRALGASEIREMYLKPFGLWEPDYRVQYKPPGKVYSPTGSGSLNLTVAASSGVDRPASATSTVDLAVAALSLQDKFGSATSTIDLSIATHTQDVPASATSSITLSASSNNIQTFSVSASSTFDLASTSSARNTIIRVSAETSLSLAQTDGSGSEFLESITSSLVLDSTSSATNTTITVSASSGLNLTNTALAVGVTYTVAANVDIIFSVTSSGGKAYSASAASSFVISASAAGNTLASSQLVITATANAFREQGPASSSLTLTTSATGTIELPQNGTSIRQAFYGGIARRFPVHYAETPSGLLLIADGIDPVLRWDGVSRNFYPAGIIAPTEAMTISSSGSGSITGTYTAYCRFVDEDGNVSDVSPVSNSLAVTGASTITYSSVPVSTEGRVTTRQILRNTDGQADTYYVDIETTDLTSTTLSSTKTDAVLATSEAVPFLDANDEVIVNLHAPPPNHKAVPASHLNRMFLAVDVEYKEGSIAVTTGSTTITGIGTRWPETFVGREIYIVGSNRSFTITDVDTSAQTLTIDSQYEAATNLYAVYAIRPQRSERRLVYYSESGLPESWPSANAFSLQDDGDEITGLVVQGSFLYVVERRHIYRFTFQADPANDGFVFLATSRGCVNQRCIVQVEDDLYMLDESGVHRYSGGENSESISVPIQNLFRPEEENGINWSADTRLWHAAHSPTQDTIRWFVSMSGSRFPRHAICYNYRQQRWWTEEYQWPMTGSAMATLGYRRPLIGSDARRILVVDHGTLDGPENSGDLSGAVTSAGPLSITDSGAVHSADGVVNAPVWITKGKGRGQGRRVVSVSSGEIVVDRPWTTQPDTTSRYQIGGIYYEWDSQWFRYLEEQESNSRTIELGFSPLTVEAYASLQLYIDYATTPKTWGYTSSQDGVEVTKNSSVISLDLTRQRGNIMLQMSGHGETYAQPEQFVSVRLSGTQGVERTRYWHGRIQGVESGSVR